MSYKDESRPGRHFGREQFRQTGDVEDQYDVDRITEYTESDFMEGRDLPGWRNIIRARGNATNPAVGAQRTRKFAGGSSYTTVTQRRYESGDDHVPHLTVFLQAKYTGSGIAEYCPDASLSVTVDPEVIDYAKAAFISRARSLMSPTQGGVILGEIRETLHLIRHPASALRNGLSSYLQTVKKRGRGLRKASVAKKNSVVAQTWLEYCFGWAPLLADIDNSMESLARLVTKVAPLTQVRVSRSSDVYDGTEFGNVSSSLENATYDISFRHKSRCSIYGALDVSFEPQPTFRGAFGLRAHDIIPTLWELIPYSFVIDYFTNIGDIVSAGSFNTQFLSWWGMTTTGENVVYTNNFQQIPHDPPTDEFSSVVGSISCGGTVSRSKVMQRSLEPVLVPSLRFQIPGIKQGFNIAALVAQARSIHL